MTIILLAIAVLAWTWSPTLALGSAVALFAFTYPWRLRRGGLIALLKTRGTLPSA